MNINTVPIGGRNQGLDVIRGIAVGLVMVRHALGDMFSAAGIVGVTIFFALSGYLITGLLIRDVEDVERPRWKRFYVHRFLRLVPALVLLVLVYALVEAAWNPLGQRSELPLTVIVALTYTSDLNLPVEMGALTHLWTLAVEEQFYLVWPALIFLAVRRRITPGRLAVTTAVVLTTVCWVSLIAVGRPEAIYTLPTTWASSMAVGAAAYCYRSRLDALLRTGLRPWGAAVGLAALVAMALAPVGKDSALTYLLYPTLVSVCTVLMIWEARRWPTAPKVAVPLLGLGTISYAAYLWNWPLVSWIGASSGIHGRELLVVSAVATVLVATVSWFTVEALGRHLRTRFDASQFATGHADDVFSSEDAAPVRDRARETALR
ncbi:acyltransferase family protein [Nocardioides flavescens]|nr:acyltransferase [Nocardioides flavescens]